MQRATGPGPGPAPQRATPDTVLFLARFAGGDRGALRAELLAVEDDGATVRTDTRPEAVRLPFDGGGGGGGPGGARDRLRRLLTATRDAHPDEPLTSLEEQMRPHGRGHPPPAH